MSKLTREQKIEIYEKRKKFETVPSIAMEYGLSIENVKYLVRLIDFHGYDVLRNGKNKTYSIELRTEYVERVLNNKESIKSIAIEAGLSSDGILRRWIDNYKANGCVIVDKKKGRSSTMTKATDNTKSYDDMTHEELKKHYEQRILYLETENEYLKKLRAVVQSRKNRQSKKK